MATKPAFAATPKYGHGNLATANTAKDGTGTLLTVLTMGASGGILFRLLYHALVTTTAGMVRYYVSTDAGTTKRLLTERPVDAVTVSASVAGFRDEWCPNLILPASAIIYASTEKAESANVHGEGGDF